MTSDGFPSPLDSSAATPSRTQSCTICCLRSPRRLRSSPDTTTISCRDCRTTSTSPTCCPTARCPPAGCRPFRLGGQASRRPPPAHRRLGDRQLPAAQSDNQGLRGHVHAHDRHLRPPPGASRTAPQLAVELAATLMGIEQVPRRPDVPQEHRRVRARPADRGSPTSTATPTTCASAGAAQNHRALVATSNSPWFAEQFTDIIASAAGDPALTERAWVLLAEAPDGGWDSTDAANANEELVVAARDAMLSGLIHAPIDATGGAASARLVLWTRCVRPR